MKKNIYSLNKLADLIKTNFLPFSLGLSTMLVSFALAVSLLILFYKPNRVNKVNNQGVVIQISPTIILKKHIVALGETLYIIAQKYYGNGDLIQKIIDANNIINPDNIEVGTTLIIP